MSFIILTVRSTNTERPGSRVTVNTDTVAVAYRAAGSNDTTVKFNPGSHYREFVVEETLDQVNALLQARGEA